MIFLTPERAANLMFASRSEKPTMRTLICFMFFLMTASSADAASIWKGTGQGGIAFIAVEGELFEGDEKTFNNLAITMEKGVVLLNGPGGRADVGMSIGRTISIKGFATGVVGQTLCASSCGLAWLAGRPRMLSAEARVGFHAIYTVENGANNVSSDGNALVGSYLRDLGFSDNVIRYATFTSPNAIKWLSKDEAASIGLEVSYLPSAAVSDAPAKAEPPNTAEVSVPDASEPAIALPIPAEAPRTMLVAPAVTVEPPPRSQSDEWKFADNLDLPGFDLPRMPIKAKTALACYKACNEATSCTAYTFNADAKACFLKRGASQALQFTRAFSGYKASNIIYRVGREYGADVRFRTNLGTEIMAMPYSTYINKTLAWCQDECVDDFQCRAFSYFRNGICVKFTASKPVRMNSEVYSGIKMD
ncbi:PAN domain-containing protein [Rhizobium sp. TRM95796]|uniref:PAN domain-containing protein n=1 Tax=Rhizobium sp. TRM95796 TaxID=2979862 RepID=UPI0021E85331|nr:PAN domain-containing protein [Rhizobium sp. TRM95796]MCV3764045.1 PAN domain-containing protein [Rhizobium sp. TRM95796]